MVGVEVAGGGRWLRAYGGLDHPNMLGGLLAIGLLIFVWVNIAQRHNLSKGNGLAPQGHFVILNYIYVLVVAVGLFFTFSRASWLGLVVGLVIMMLIAIIKKDLMSQKKILKTVLVTGIISFVMYVSFGDLVETRFANDTRLEHKSTNERVESMYLASEIIRSEPVIGVGIGNYTNFIHKHVRSDEVAYTYQPVHNTFWLVASEIGFFGSLFFLSIFIFLILSLFKRFLQAGSSCYNLGIIF